LAEHQFRQSWFLCPYLPPERHNVMGKICQLAEPDQQPDQHNSFPIGGGIDRRL